MHCFAYLIFRSGLKAIYEFHTDKQTKKSIDFKVFGDKIKKINLLIEISSLRESELQKGKTWEKDSFFGCVLSGNDDISDYFKAQKILIEKAKKFSSKKKLTTISILYYLICDQVS